MSGETPPNNASGRKICVARRRRKPGSASTLSSLSQNIQQQPGASAAAPNAVSASHAAPPVVDTGLLSFAALASQNSSQVTFGTTEGIESKNSTASAEQTVSSGGSSSKDVDEAADSFSKVSLQESQTKTLFNAIRLDDITLLNELLLNKSTVTDQLDYALTMAVTKKSSEMAELLLKNGANPKYLDQCYPLLSTATDLNDTRIVELLLEYGADPNIQGMHGTPLHSAMRFGTASLVKKLLDAGAKINQANIWSLMNVGMRSNNIECLDLILNKHPKETLVNVNGKTLLHLAAELGKINLVKHLLDHGFNPLVSDDDGYLPWMMAVKYKHEKAADLLFPPKDKINAPLCEKEKRPLHCACFTGLRLCVERLIKAGGDVNVQDIEGVTPMVVALEQGHLQVARSILSLAKVDPFLSDTYGTTSFSLALEKVRFTTDLADTLIRLGADVNHRMRGNRTPLMENMRYPETVKYLLAAGANPLLTSDENATALGKGVDGGHEESIRILLEENVPLEHLYLPWSVDPEAGETPMEIAILHHKDIMKFLLYAGCSITYLSKWLPSPLADDVRGSKPQRVKCLEHCVKQGPNLKELSRNAILKCIGYGNVPEKITKLGLPSKFTDFFDLKVFMEWRKKQYNITDEEFPLEDDDDFDDYVLYDEDEEDDEDDESYEESDENDFD